MPSGSYISSGIILILLHLQGALRSMFLQAHQGETDEGNGLLDAFHVAVRHTELADVLVAQPRTHFMGTVKASLLKQMNLAPVIGSLPCLLYFQYIFYSCHIVLLFYVLFWGDALNSELRADSSN